MRKSALAITAAVAVSLAPTAAPTADARKGSSKAVKKVYRDCSDGKLTKRHKTKVLKQAKRKLPRDIKQYTSCEKTIKKELRKRAKRR